MAGTTFETRHAQMFPRLEPAEIERLRRFGRVVRAKAGEALATAGVASPGLFVVLDGRVAITRRDAHDGDGDGGGLQDGQPAHGRVQRPVPGVHGTGDGAV